MKICIITNKYKDPKLEVTKSVERILREKRISYDLITFDSRIKNSYDMKISQDTDFVLTIGGDGTIIGVCRNFNGINFPIAGINLGRVGYLADIEVKNIKSAINKLIKQNYHIEKRMMIDGFKVSRNQKFLSTSLNDIVIKTSNPFKTILVDMYVDNKFVTTYNADGLIISTPTGSTAYNLSASGPIIFPGMNSILVTPICSYALGLGTIVFDGNSEIVLDFKYNNRERDIKYKATFDGVLEKSFSEGEKLLIKRSNDVANFIKFDDASFLETLREKIKNADIK